VTGQATEVAAAWGLAPHPEGGFYRETYRSAVTFEPAGWPGARSLATAIIYLLPAGERSVRHRIRGEELWLWQGGAPMALTIGEEEHVVGPDRPSGHRLQVLVPAGEWQSATAVTAAGAPAWSMVACLVAPGFDFQDFEVG
jgi:predicted cupin superfamily sugar epimerase